eukprot:TRINITY_DN1711_c0_g2_i1.p1 TRINITY_DN1711_c0_g2~~TRINITY_DN1711_c0_g2_i1.p1  ORF type:complete len:276 (+),score=68.84 TRINITY_DN1711_c0_g2_i1:59-829(+)
MTSYFATLKHEGIEAFLASVGEVDLGTRDDVGKKMTAEEFEVAGDSLIKACPGAWEWVGDGEKKEVLIQKQANCYKRCRDVAEDFEKVLEQRLANEAQEEEEEEEEDEEESESDCKPTNEADDDDDPMATINVKYPSRVYDIHLFRHSGRSVPTCCFEGWDYTTPEKRHLTVKEMFEDVMPSSQHIVTQRLVTQRSGLMHIHTCQHASDMKKRSQQMRNPPKHHDLSTFLSLVREHLPTIDIMCCTVMGDKDDDDE